ncbi:riboflavin biosynthesis protein RibD, partial [Xanthomonas oryzae pv. oryzae]
LRTLACKNIRNGDAPTLYLHGDAVAATALDGAECAALPLHVGRFDLSAVLALLAERGINEVHVEAGATLSGALLQAGLVDELLVYMAPVLLGDTARPLLAGLGIETMAQRYELQLRDVRQLGQDLRLRYAPSAVV